MDLKSINVKELEKLVIEKKKTVEEIIRSVKTLIIKKGEVTERKVSRFHTHVVEELRNFSNFDFILSTGESDMGGETLTIKFKSEIVFEVDASGNLIKEGRVIFFENKNDWQTEFENAIKHKKEIFKKMKKDKNSEKSEDEKKHKEEEEKNKLIEEAKRLKVL